MYMTLWLMALSIMMYVGSKPNGVLNRTQFVENDEKDENLSKTRKKSIRSWLRDNLGTIQKVRLLKRGGEGEVIEKRTKTNKGRDVLACVYSHFF